MSDRTVIRYRKSRGGVWYPEDRLRAALSGALIFVPLSTLLYGIVTGYIGGPVGMVLDFICLFANGIGVCYVSWASLESVVLTASSYVRVVGTCVESCCCVRCRRVTFTER